MSFTSCLTHLTYLTYLTYSPFFHTPVAMYFFTAATVRSMSACVL